MSAWRQILLADDDEQVQRAVTRVSEKLGCNVIHVTIGADVLRRAIETKPELIVLDVSFPDADGRDILTALKSDPERPKSRCWCGPGTCATPKAIARFP